MCVAADDSVVVSAMIQGAKSVDGNDWTASSMLCNRTKNTLTGL